jgi:23S rRNA pseudouridine1911/1915/1917 synthase
MQNTLGRLDRQALHAEKLAFTHPMSGTLLEFNSALPADLAEIAVSLKDL